MQSKAMRPVASQEEDGNTLWDKFVEGDLEVWEQIFQQHYSDLYGYGLKLSSQPELTKDCIHELFLILWERREHLGEVRSIKAYLLTSLRRRLLKTMKKRRSTISDRKGPNDKDGLRIQFSPEVILIRDEVKAGKLERLYSALDELPPRQKEVLYLKYFNGMSYSEIEDILSIQYQSIKNHIYRAIQNLREIMGDEFTKIAISLIPFMVSLALKF